MPTTNVLETPEADIAHDLHGPLPTADGRPPLFMVGQPMDARGFATAAMATFIAMTSWRGEFTDDYFAQPAPDPARLGMPTDDDGSRDDPLLSDRSWAITSYRPDLDALAAAPTRIVIAVGEESLDTFAGRTAVATAPGRTHHRSLAGKTDKAQGH